MTTAQRDLIRRVQPGLFDSVTTIKGPLFVRPISDSGNPIYTLTEAIRLINHCEQSDWPGPIDTGDNDPPDDLIEDYTWDDR